MFGYGTFAELTFAQGPLLQAAVVVEPAMDMHDGWSQQDVDYSKLERSREIRERKVRQSQDELTRIVRNAFQKVTGEPEPEKTVAPKVELKVAREAIKVIRLEGLDDVATSMANILSLIRDYEQTVQEQRRIQKQNNDALAILLLAA